MNTNLQTTDHKMSLIKLNVDLQLEIFKYLSATDIINMKHLCEFYENFTNQYERFIWKNRENENLKFLTESSFFDCYKQRQKFKNIEIDYINNFEEFVKKIFSLSLSAVVVVEKLIIRQISTIDFKTECLLMKKQSITPATTNASTIPAMNHNFPNLKFFDISNFSITDESAILSFIYANKKKLISLKLKSRHNVQRSLMYFDYKEQSLYNRNHKKLKISNDFENLKHLVMQNSFQLEFEENNCNFVLKRLENLSINIMFHDHDQLDNLSLISKYCINLKKFKIHFKCPYKRSDDINSFNYNNFLQKLCFSNLHSLQTVVFKKFHILSLLKLFEIFENYKYCINFKLKMKIDECLNYKYLQNIFSFFNNKLSMSIVKSIIENLTTKIYFEKNNIFSFNFVNLKKIKFCSEFDLFSTPSSSSSSFIMYIKTLFTLNEKTLKKLTIQNEENYSNSSIDWLLFCSLNLFPKNNNVEILKINKFNNNNSSSQIEKDLSIILQIFSNLKLLIIKDIIITSAAATDESIINKTIDKNNFLNNTMSSSSLINNEKKINLKFKTKDIHENVYNFNRNYYYQVV